MRNWAVPVVIFLSLISGAAAKEVAQESIAALARSYTPDSTAKLLALLDTTNVEQLLPCLDAVTARLPVPVYSDRECPFTDLRTEHRRKAASRAWESRFNLQARKLAYWFLRHEDVRVAARGALIMTCVGTIEDTPAVLGAMTRILDLSADPKAQPGYMPGWFDAFLMASQGQLYRGWQVTPDPKSSGEIVTYINRLSTDKKHRPTDWKKRCKQWLDHPHSYIRHLAKLHLSGVY